MAGPLQLIARLRSETSHNRIFHECGPAQQGRGFEPLWEFLLGEDQERKVARLQAPHRPRSVPPVPPCESSGEPLEAAPALEVPPVPRVPSHKHKAQDTSEAAPTPHESPAQPQADRRSAWAVARGGRPICHMVGEPMTHAEALEAARWRWPDADILES